MLTSSNHGNAIHENVSDAVRDLMRIFICGTIDHGLGVENDDVRVETLPEYPAIGNRETCCDGRRHFPDGVLEG